MECKFCKQDVKEWDNKQVGYLIASTYENGDNNLHTHVHGTLTNKNVAEDLINASIKETGLTNLFRDKFKNPLTITEVIFHNRQRIGDIFMFTCAVRDFKKAYPHIKVGVISTAMHIWDNNPYVDTTLKPYYKNGKTLETIKPEDLLNGDTNVLKIGPGKLTNASNRLDWHFANAYRISIEDQLGIKFDQGESRPDIWLTEEEYNAPRITDKPYWIIITGGEQGWGCKMYPTVRWQEFIDQNPNMLFYQLGAKSDNHVRLKGPNVVDYIGKTEDRDTGVRDLIKLFLNAEGSVGLVSFHMHLSGGLYKPSVVVAGAREPVSFTRYAGHQYIANDGCLPCATTACWHCDLKTCTNRVIVDGEEMPKCVDMIKASDVTAYFKRYYEGGRLSYDKPSEKPKLKNIVKTAKLAVPVSTPLPTNINTYGLTFGGGAITDRDWDFISKTIDEHKVTSVLEFGAGLSTLLLNDKLKEVVTFEDKQSWLDKVKSLKSYCDIRLWDGKSMPIDRDFDMAFVDGPAGGASREEATKFASEHAKIIIVHDAGRENEKKWQDKYIKDSFDGPIKGGHRCHLWIKKANDYIPPVIKVPTAKKSIKFVSTARGWGGCARSITTLMKLLLSEGHKVEFIPFRNSVGSKEFKDFIKSDLQELKVTESYNTVKDPCDILFMYADDYIWEFEKPEVSDVFSNLKAEKKIMTLNYRRGAVGKAPWTKDWDKYIFLNSAQEKDLLKLLPGASTKVLAPCTDLSQFVPMRPKFDSNIKIVRHSSQGDTKYAPTFSYEVDRILSARDGATISLMPGPSFIKPDDRLFLMPRNTPPVPEFLATGNLFWYSLPEGYMDMGPRVIIEAMAVGLPVIADNWGGAVDRVTKETGWLGSKDYHVEVITNVTMKELERKGNAAKDRALTCFDMRAWLKEIL